MTTQSIVNNSAYANLYSFSEATGYALQHCVCAFSLHVSDKYLQALLSNRRT